MYTVQYRYILKWPNAVILIKMMTHIYTNDIRITIELKIIPIN